MPRGSLMFLASCVARSRPHTWMRWLPRRPATRFCIGRCQRCSCLHRAAGVSGADRCNPQEHRSRPAESSGRADPLQRGTHQRTRCDAGATPARHIRGRPRTAHGPAPVEPVRPRRLARSVSGDVGERTDNGGPAPRFPARIPVGLPVSLLQRRADGRQQQNSSSDR
jgi:hypothetical protein